MKRIGFPNLEGAGRLGNQLWQIASTLGMARARGVEPVFPDWSYRQYFSLPEHWFDGDALAGSADARRISGLPPTLREYVQQWRFVAPVIDEILEVFQPSHLAAEILADHLRLTGQTYLLDLDAVTLHVRRGDNTDPVSHPPGTWPLVTMDYYRAALARFDPASDLVIFSDDPGWCEDHAGDLAPGWGGCVFVTHSGPTRPPDYEPDAYHAAPAMDWIDLQLMAMFRRGHVISNSTYSLWGAVLGGGPTTYPNNWVGPVLRHSLPDESTICPPEWTMIENPSC